MNGNGVIVVLSGGGGRALAHLGVLEVLEDAGVPIERIIGVSAGAVAGALYASHANAREAQRHLSEQLACVRATPACRRVARLARSRAGISGAVLRLLGAWRLLNRTGIVRADYLLRTMDAIIGDTKFEDLRIPLSVVTTDLASGREAVIGSGPLQPYLAATCALPGVFEPIPVGERLLVDSGDVNPLPVHVAHRYRPAFTIASDVSRGKLPPLPRLNGVEAVARSRDVGALVFRGTELRLADFLVQPRVLRRDWSDFNDPEQAYQAGRAAARRRIDRLCAGLHWKEIASCKVD